MDARHLAPVPGARQRVVDRRQAFEGGVGGGGDGGRVERPAFERALGAAQLSCLTLAASVEGRSVETLESLKSGPRLHPLQQAFMDRFAAQCGYCTPGMLMAAKALLDRNPSPTRAEVVEAISGNICRCTGYEAIIDAVLDAAQTPRARA